MDVPTTLAATLSPPLEVQGLRPAGWAREAGEAWRALLVAAVVLAWCLSAPVVAQDPDPARPGGAGTVEPAAEQAPTASSAKPAGQSPAPAGDPAGDSAPNPAPEVAAQTRQVLLGECPHPAFRVTGGDPEAIRLLGFAQRIAAWDLREPKAVDLGKGPEWDRLEQVRQGLRSFLQQMAAEIRRAGGELPIDLPSPRGGSGVEGEEAGKAAGGNENHTPAEESGSQDKVATTRYRIVAVDISGRRVDVVRPGEARGIPLVEIAPERLAQALYRAAALTDQQHRDALRFLVSLRWQSMGAVERQRAETIARRVGISHRDPLAMAFGPTLRAQGLLADARSAIAAGTPLPEVRQRLLASWELVQNTAAVRTVLQRQLPDLARDAFTVDRDWPRVVLGGATKWLPDGRLEVFYGWEDAQQAGDFWRVPGGVRGFCYYPDKEPGDDPVAELQSGGGGLSVRGRGYFAHVLQWCGPMEIRVDHAADWNGPQGVWLIHAQRPNHFLGLQRDEPDALLAASCGGERQLRPLDGGALEASVDYGNPLGFALRLRLDGDGVRVSSAERDLATLLHGEQPKAAPQGGAVMFLQPWGPSATQDRDAWLAAPSAKAGPVTIRGKVMTERLGAAQARYLDAWLRLLLGAGPDPWASPAQAGDAAPPRAEAAESKEPQAVPLAPPAAPSTPPPGA